MLVDNYHSFHIPVMGLAFTIDTPLKVAKYGIASVISIVDDGLLEDMRRYYCEQYRLPYTYITADDPGNRSKRITAYLDMVADIVNIQVGELRQQQWTADSDICKYFNMLPTGSPLREKYIEMMAAPSPGVDQILRDSIIPGAIDVNIMAKVDKDNYSKNGDLLPVEYSDALSALKGFADSKLQSSVVFSAGYNPRLYSYLEQFDCFYPGADGQLLKKVILKVSDYRSALVQGKILAKKGIWVSEFRIESGINCGGHAFPTDGLLLGPILQEFKDHREALRDELVVLCRKAQAERGMPVFKETPEQRITAQGGVGTAAEHSFLLDYYQLNSIGWGSPFLLVPEATSMDEQTLRDLAGAQPDDFYLSRSSPLGVPFNNFRRSSSERQRRERIEKGRPGSPCYKKYLVNNSEFTDTPICTASRQYQHLKLQQLQNANSPQLAVEIADMQEKDCLCEGLSAPVLLKYEQPLNHKLSAVVVCPGPNLAYFSGTRSLKEIIDHIYGRLQGGNGLPRPHMFINELLMYINYYRDDFKKGEPDEKARRQQNRIKDNLLIGIEYYLRLIPLIGLAVEQETFADALSGAKESILQL